MSTIDRKGSDMAKTIYVLGAALQLRDNLNVGQVMHEITFHPSGDAAVFELADGGMAFICMTTDPQIVYVHTPDSEPSK